MQAVGATKTSLLLAVALLGAGLSAAQGQIAPEPLTGAERIELETLRAQLTDPDRTAKTRAEAANLLLTRSYVQAVALAVELLGDETNRPAQVAVAQAVATTGQTRTEFIKPLLAMLTGPEPSVRSPAAVALAAYKDGGVLKEFIRRLSDPQTDRATRLVIVEAMQRILDKKAVDALVALVDDPDEAIRDAACDALSKMTNINAFGRTPDRWKDWWSRNKDKPPGLWLAELANSLSRANLELARENAELRKRLASAMNDLYQATPPAGRDNLLVEMLKDPLAEVRLAGARISQQRLAAGSNPLPEALAAQIRGILSDPSPPVRREAALLAARARTDQTVKLLTDRLKAEAAPEVREALYQALAMVGSSEVWDLLVTGVGEQNVQVATTAATALAHLAEKNGIKETRLAAAALKQRYDSADKDLTALREALLTAMGALKDKSLAGLMTSALSDPAATVRLSAIKALQSLRAVEHAAAIAPLAADSDRGVRLAAIKAVGALGNGAPLETVLARTDAGVEPDPAVRQQAWTVVLTMLEKADPERLSALADQLARRDDAVEYQIELLKLWVAKTPADKAGEWVPVRLRLGEALLSVNRPAEAAVELETVQRALAKSGSSDATRVWLRWVEALLAADDVAAVARIAESTQPGPFASGTEALLKRLAGLQSGKQWDSLVRLATAALDRLGDRFSEPQKKQVADALAEARRQQQQADRQRVTGLVARLGGTDESARQAAQRELTAMKDRAVRPLVLELRSMADDQSGDPASEQAIVKLLGAIAPQLTGYDSKAPREQRLAKIDEWLKLLES